MKRRRNREPKPQKCDIILHPFLNKVEKVQTNKKKKKKKKVRGFWLLQNFQMYNNYFDYIFLLYTF